MASLSDQQGRILHLARIVWENQHLYDLDTVDGTFYWRGCRWELVDPLIEEAKRDPNDAASRLGNLIPGFGMSQGGAPINEQRIPMRGAVTSVGTRPEWLSNGETVNGRSWKARAVITTHVRNAEWSGEDVADAIHLAWRQYQRLFPADYWNDHLAYLGASSPEHVVMDMHLGPNREGRLVDVSEEATFRFEPGETVVRFTHKPAPEWDYEPRIEVEVSAPPPAKPVIAAWFDDVAIEAYGWPSQLRGAKNGQDIATAIRTWTIALLMLSGLNYYDASREAELLNLYGFVGVSQSKFGKDKRLLLMRVREAEPFLSKPSE